MLSIPIKCNGQLGSRYWQINSNEKLGQGSFGAVFKATLDNSPCAAKVLYNISRHCGHADNIARFLVECELLTEIKHPCIVQILGVAATPNHDTPILLMELMKKNLNQFLSSSRQLPYHIQVNIIHDITLALTYLHRNGVIHRDLSCKNVLINAEIRAKVTDFGMAKVFSSFKTGSQNTRCPGMEVFMPPEALREMPNYSEKLDVFSTGVLIIQIITCRFPAPGEASIVTEDPKEPTGVKITLIPEHERRKENISHVPRTHSLLPTIYHCLEDKDTLRPSAAELCQGLAVLKTSLDYKESRTLQVIMLLLRALITIQHTWVWAHMHMCLCMHMSQLLHP